MAEPSAELWSVHHIISCTDSASILTLVGWLSRSSFIGQREGVGSAWEDADRPAGALDQAVLLCTRAVVERISTTGSDSMYSITGSGHAGCRLGRD